MKTKQHRSNINSNNTQPSITKRIAILLFVVFLSFIFLFFIHDFLVLDERNSIHHQIYQTQHQLKSEQHQVNLHNFLLQDLNPDQNQQQQQQQQQRCTIIVSSNKNDSTANADKQKTKSLFAPPRFQLRVKNVFRQPRSYSRLTGADVLAPDLHYVSNATLFQCLRLCDRNSLCNYVVRNLTHLNVDRNSGPGPCWIKRAVVFNPFPHLKRETWVISRAPQPKIAIGILSAPKFIDNRLAAAFSTWLRDEDCVVMMENTGAAKSKVEKIFGAVAARGQPAFNTRGAIGTRVMFLFEDEDKNSEPGAWKNLLLLKTLPAAYLRMMRGVSSPVGSVKATTTASPSSFSSSSSDAFHSAFSASSPASLQKNDSSENNNNNNLPDWYFVVDDDTFAFVRSIRYMLAVALPSEAQYTGLLMSARDYTSGSHFIQGGAGILLSDETMRRTYPKIDSCLDLCKQKYGDFRTGCCVIQAAQIDGTFHRAFYSYSAWENNAATMQRKMYGTPMFPGTFHRFRKVEMITLFHKHIKEYLSVFAAKSHEQNANRFYGSRYRMFPPDKSFSRLRSEVEDVNSGTIKVPYSRRRWAFVDDLISQKVMYGLKPLPFSVLVENNNNNNNNVSKSFISAGKIPMFSRESPNNTNNSTNVNSSSSSTPIPTTNSKIVAENVYENQRAAIIIVDDNNNKKISSSSSPSDKSFPQQQQLQQNAELVKLAKEDAEFAVFALDDGKK